MRPARSVGSIGTMGFRLDGIELPLERTTVTTPEAPELQRLLAMMVERGADTVLMEVSSHALEQRRTDPIRFDVAAFTNLGRDHLDFHPDLESYFEAKARLFTPERTRFAVINYDDPKGRELERRLRGFGIVVATVGRDSPDSAAGRLCRHRVPAGFRRDLDHGADADRDARVPAAAAG